MNTRWITGIAAALVAVALVAVPGTAGEKSVLAAAAARMEQEQPRLEEMQRKLEAEIAQLQVKFEMKMAELMRHRGEIEVRLAEAQAQLESKLRDRSVEELAQHAEQRAKLAQELAARHAELAGELAQERVAQALDHTRLLAQQGGVLVEPEVTWFSDEDGSGWLGVTIEEVNADRAKEAKLPNERGVYLKEVSNDTPAAKAGLKAGDIITEFNGTRIEGTAQFRRMIRETPAGRTVQLTVWRDGRAQQITATLGSMEEIIRKRVEDRIQVFKEPRVFTFGGSDFRFDMPKVDLFAGPRTPLLGIQGDDLSGQLGSYFGAPDGEGVLIREVTAGSPAEKAGLKAGDVITKVEGERVRSTSELRSALREKREKKTVAIGVLRNRSEMTLNVEIEQPKPREPARKIISRRTSV